MKTLRSNLEVLIARKNQNAPPGTPRISKRSLSKELGISRYTIYAFANNTLEEFPRGMLESLCTYFDCDIGQLMSMKTLINLTDPQYRDAPEPIDDMY
jgi:DNA-binding Xre family transcriptional regulator